MEPRRPSENFLQVLFNNSQGCPWAPSPYQDWPLLLAPRYPPGLAQGFLPPSFLLSSLDCSSICNWFSASLRHTKSSSANFPPS